MDEVLWGELLGVDLGWVEEYFALLLPLIRAKAAALLSRCSVDIRVKLHTSFYYRFSYTATVPSLAISRMVGHNEKW